MKHSLNICVESVVTHVLFRSEAERRDNIIIANTVKCVLLPPLEWSCDLNTFQRLGVPFDVYSGESFHQEQAREVVQLLQTRGLLKTTE